MNTGATEEESTLKHNNYDLEGLKLMLYLLAYVSYTLIIFFKQWKHYAIHHFFVSPLAITNHFTIIQATLEFVELWNYGIFR